MPLAALLAQIAMSAQGQSATERGQNAVSPQACESNPNSSKSTLPRSLNFLLDAVGELRRFFLRDKLLTSMVLGQRLVVAQTNLRAVIKSYQDPVALRLRCWSLSRAASRISLLTKNEV